MGARYQIEVLSGWTDGKPSWSKRSGMLLRVYRERADAESEIARLSGSNPDAVYRIRKVTKR